MRSEHEREFADFFDRASPRLLSAAWMLAGDQHTAEDLAQEALARTYARWSRVRGGQPLAYARRTLVNLHTDRWRKHRREVLTDAAPEGLVADPQAASHLDLSEKQTAETLGISVGSVKNYTMHGLRFPWSDGGTAYALVDVVLPDEVDLVAEGDGQWLEPAEVHVVQGRSGSVTVLVYPPGSAQTWGAAGVRGPDGEVAQLPLP